MANCLNFFLCFWIWLIPKLGNYTELPELTNFFKPNVMQNFITNGGYATLVTGKLKNCSLFFFACAKSTLGFPHSHET